MRYCTLQETNISPKNGILKMIFLFPRWDMLIPWRVVGTIMWWILPVNTRVPWAIIYVSVDSRLEMIHHYSFEQNIATKLPVWSSQMVGLGKESHEVPETFRLLNYSNLLRFIIIFGFFLSPSWIGIHRKYLIKIWVKVLWSICQHCLAPTLVNQ